MTSLAESQSREHGSDRKDKAKELRRQIDDSLDTLAKAVDEVRASEAFKAYLDVQARFHRYSWHNSMLIAVQRPNATHVAGYQTWRKLGRQVNKGEQGIMIFAPCPWKRETDDGETEQGIFFRAVHVFDVAQTDGPADRLGYDRCAASWRGKTCVRRVGCSRRRAEARHLRGR